MLKNAVGINHHKLCPAEKLRLILTDELENSTLPEDDVKCSTGTDLIPKVAAP
jgi:hypothetical protein